MLSLYKRVLFSIFLVLFVASCTSATAPNVLFIFADDLGYNDISWHNQDIISPNLEKLAKEGVILEGHYVNEMCTPTRSALLTSYYPSHTGRQHRVIAGQEPVGLYTNYTLMSEYFQEIGYQTHAVGKWHLGYCSEDYLPTRRGFDTFYGYYLGTNNYYEHIDTPTKGDDTPGYDWRDQDEADFAAKGTYSSILLTERAVEIIDNHASNDDSKPMFMYLAFQNVHGPLMVPIEYEEMYPDIEDRDRRRYSGMVTAMDDAVGIIIDKLKDAQLFDNTIIVFSSDNGGKIKSGGNNFPLRGAKATLWEGGTRSVAFIHSPLLNNKGSINDNLIHVVDWTPTLLTAVKEYLPLEHMVKVDNFLSEERDGIDQWSMLAGDGVSKRNEILYNIDPLYREHPEDGVTIKGHGAIRIGNLKLAIGNPGEEDGHYPPANHIKDEDGVLMETVDKNRTPMPYILDDGLKAYLFDLVDDPYENTNIAEQNQETVEQMRQRLKEFESTMIPPNIAKDVDEGNPSHFNGTWSYGWCESQPN